MKIFKLIFLFVFLFLQLTSAVGQEKIQTESNTHIYWQPDRELIKSDFKGDSSCYDKSELFCDELDMCTMAFVGVFAVLDIPKKKRKRGELIEKAYFVPAFEKSTSYILKNDTAGIKKQKVIFDIYEISARFARLQLSNFQDSIPGYGITTIMFMTVESRAIEMRTYLVDSYTKDVFIDKIDGSYKIWRDRIDKMLTDSEKYSTKPEDCYRFIKNEPIEKSYIKAKNVVGNMDKR